MTLGYAPVRARKHLDDLITDFPFAQWHTGDPGAAGTANVAANTTRVDLTGKFGGATTAGATTTKASNAAVTVSGVPASEDYTHVSFWSLASGGTFGGSALVTANALTSGDNLTIPSGGISLTAANAA
jgi:hypothetical protein